MPQVCPTIIFDNLQQFIKTLYDNETNRQVYLGSLCAVLLSCFRQRVRWGASLHHPLGGESR